MCRGIGAGVEEVAVGAWVVGCEAVRQRSMAVEGRVEAEERECVKRCNAARGPRWNSDVIGSWHAPRKAEMPLMMAHPILQAALPSQCVSEGIYIEHLRLALRSEASTHRVAVRFIRTCRKYLSQRHRNRYLAATLDPFKAERRIPNRSSD